MPLRDDIERQFIEAMKAKDAERLNAIRNLRAAVKSAEIDKRPEPLTEDDVLAVVGREVKKLKDAMAEFEQAGRADLADANKKEIAILAGYLPEQMSEAGIRAVVEAYAKEHALSGEAAFGKLMGLCTKQLKGKADGALIGKVVKEILSA